MIKVKIKGTVLAFNTIKVEDKILDLSNIDVRIHSRVTGKRKGGELIEEIAAPFTSAFIFNPSFVRYSPLLIL